MSFLYVKVYYGPCHTFDSCIHKPQLLHGLRHRLEQLGFRVDILPVEFENYCMLEICGHEVFRCNLKHLKFNMVYHKDKVATNAVQAVLQASVKFRRARAYLWFWTLMDHQLFRRGAYAPKDYWAKNIFTFSSVAYYTKLENPLYVVYFRKTRRESIQFEPYASDIRITAS